MQITQLLTGALLHTSVGHVPITATGNSNDVMDVKNSSLLSSPIPSNEVTIGNTSRRAGNNNLTNISEIANITSVTNNTKQTPFTNNNNRKNVSFSMNKVS